MLLLVQAESRVSSFVGPGLRAPCWCGRPSSRSRPDCRETTREGGATLVGQTQLMDKLRELGRNLWWTWQPNVIALFRELDPTLWRKVDHNPVEFLKRLPVEQLERRAAEMALDSRIDYAFRRLAEYLQDTDSWGSIHATILRARPVAYFSAEFGLHESLPIYSGGLGVLAGDHLKSASDLGIPLIGVGLLYAQGYFRQTLDLNGWQQELYLNADIDLLPIESVVRPDGQPLLVKIETTTGTLHARVWRVEVGRTMLLLLDSNVPENSESDRSLTARLYGGDARVRIRQELLLGVGGVRALHALKVHPSVLHLNEGHSAFATLEMIRSIDGDDRPAVRRGRARRLGHDRLYDPHAGGRRPRPLSRPAGRRAPGQDPRGPPPVVRGLHGAGTGLSGRPQRAVLHDRAGTQVIAVRQRRQRVARHGLATDVAAALRQHARGERADRPHHERSSRAELGRAPDAPRCSTGTWGPTGPRASDTPRPGRRSIPSPTPNSGRRSRSRKPG